MPEGHLLFSAAKKVNKNAAAEPSPLNFGRVPQKGMNSSLRSSDSIPFLTLHCAKIINAPTLRRKDRVAGFFT